MTKKELLEAAWAQMPAAASYSRRSFAAGFEACYRLLTTPRPMSELPDGISTFRLFNDDGSWGGVTLFKDAYYWEDDVLGYGYAGHPPKPLDLAAYAGWLPIFEPLKEDANG